MTPRIRLVYVLLGAMLLSVGAVAAARAQDSGLKGIAESLGFAANPPPPAPFVADTRPAGDLPWIGAFAPPPEPSLAPLTPQQLQALKAELEATDKRHQALRMGFPASAKALADERQREAAAKAKKKKLPLDSPTPAAAGQ